MRSIPAISAILLLLGALTGCSDDPKPIEPSGSPTATADAWKKNFSSEQLAEYGKAMARLQAWEDDSAAVWDAGKVTPEAEALAEEYWIAPPLPLRELRTLEAYDVTTSGTIKILWSRATGIELRGQQWEVRIQRCRESKVSVVQHGKPVPQKNQGPRDYYVLLWATADEPYKIVNVDIGGQPGTHGGKACEA